MPELHLDHLSKRYRRREWALEDLDLVIDDKEFVVVLGPSDSGKSTLLRMISGMEKPSRGAVYLDGVPVGKKTPSTGKVGMVFRNHALYPRMTIRENIAYSLKLQHMPAEQIIEKVEHVAEVFQITRILDQKPAAVSMEQRRIVAVARAVVRGPQFVLLDEPFAGLDDGTRHRMRQMLQGIYRQMDATFLYVTHDPAEAMALGTRILILRDGRIQQMGTPQEVYSQPASVFVAGLIGVPAMNFWSAKVTVDIENGKEKQSGREQTVSGVCLQLEDLGKYSLSKEMAAALRERGYVGREMIAGVRPEQIHLQKNGPLSAISSFYGMDDAGGYLYLESRDKQVTVRVERGQEPELGSVFFFDIEESDIHLFDDVSQQRIVFDSLTERE
ncbi:MAG: ABC transporter ATP-binding protein [Lachnospiraceae bacterium]|nr:ABC transporter ATP-binding protein [Lachnospiraceae bacterium]